MGAGTGKTLNTSGGRRAVATKRNREGWERCFQGRPVRTSLDAGKKRTGNTKGGSEFSGLGSGNMEPGGGGGKGVFQRPGVSISTR